MPNYAGIVENLVAGDWRQIPFQVTNVPTGGALVQGWFTVKEDAADTDPQAIFVKIITTTLDVTKGHITNDGSIGGVATGFFNLLMADTILLTPEQEYVYDMQFRLLMIDSSNRIETPEIGIIKAKDGVTDAVS